MRRLACMLLIGALAACGPGVIIENPSESAIPVASGQTPTSTVPASAAPSDSTASLSPIAGPCVSEIGMGVLPSWARAGFSDPEPAMPHVMSRSGDVVAILFGYPLSSPPRAEVNNKILWVLRDGLDSPVAISAQRMSAAVPVGEAVARRLDDGFGPSIVDLPEPGCWRLTLMFAGRIDTIDLEYALSPTS